LGEFVTAFVGHDDPPKTPSPAPPQGDRYSLALAASGDVIGQVMASLVRDAFAVFQVKKITRHSDLEIVTVQPDTGRIERTFVRRRRRSMRR
jgi:hypothetical protein